jgi:DNA-binding SARP family transcriptional activator/tetratricopeptide (TPR) repeat protein
MFSGARRDVETLQVRLLGGLEVVRGGVQRPLPASRKTRGLIAYLALAPRPCRREDLCDLLWDDVSDPRRELRWSLSKLRVLLGPWLTASPDGIGIAGEGFTVDAAAFRDLAAPPRSGTGLTQALALWQGEPLGNADVPGAQRFHLWRMAQREALTELHRQLLHERVDQLWASPGDALVVARTLVALYPFDEWGHARVAQALTRCGRRHEAGAYLSTTREVLSNDVGVPPAAVLTDVPTEPVERMVRTQVVARPKIAVLPLEVAPQDDALQVTAMHVVSALLLGLWQSGLCEVVELDCQFPDAGAPVPDFGYVVRGSLTRLDGSIRLSLRCVDGRRGTVLWFARFGPNHTVGAALTGWIGRAISAIQSLIQTTELRRVLESTGGRDRNVGDLLRETFSLASSLEPLANQRALVLLDTVLNEAPDDPLGLALAAWCHVQRSVYQWSANPESDRGDAERFARAAVSQGANDPSCLTILGTTRTMLADQSRARALLVRALELNPYASWAHARIGWVDVYLGRAERAVHHLRTSLRLAPRDAGIFNTMTALGIAYFISGQHGGAIEWMEKGLALNPRAIWINRNLAPAYVAAGRQADAERSVRALLDAYPKLSVAAVLDAMVMSRPTMVQIAEGLARAGLPSG